MPVELYATPPNWVSEEEFSDIFFKCGKFVDSIFDTLTVDNRSLKVACIVYENAATRCHATKLAKAAYEVWIPIGFLEKAIILYLIAARHSSQSNSIIQSPLDRSNIPAYVPTILQPLFDRKNRATQNSLDRIKAVFTDEVSPDFPPLVDTISSSLNFLIAHEFSHISLSHFEFQAEYLGSRNIFSGKSIGFTEYEIKQGLEVGADLEAIQLCITNFWQNDKLSGVLFITNFWNDKFSGVMAEDEFRSVIRPFLLGITIGICLFDSQKRHLDDESLSYYQHPLIRLHMICDAIVSSAPNDFIKNLIQEEIARSVFWVNSGLAGAFIYGVTEDNFLNGDMQKAAMTIPLSSLTTDTNKFFASVIDERIGIAYQRYKRASLKVSDMKDPLMRISLDIIREIDKHWEEYQDSALAAILKEIELRKL